MERAIFSPPTKLRWSRKENLREGTKTPEASGFTRKHDRRPRTANSRCILDRQRRLPKTLRDHVRSASALSALKKVWSPTCPLNGSFQSPNCPLKGFFHSPNGIFYSQMAGWRPIFRALQPTWYLWLSTCTSWSTHGRISSLNSWPHNVKKTIRSVFDSLFESKPESKLCKKKKKQSSNAMDAVDAMQ